jgi:hypothetical protein
MIFNWCRSTYFCMIRSYFIRKYLCDALKKVIRLSYPDLSDWYFSYHISWAGDLFLHCIKKSSYTVYCVCYILHAIAKSPLLKYYLSRRIFLLLILTNLTAFSAVTRTSLWIWRHLLSVLPIAPPPWSFKPLFLRVAGDQISNSAFGIRIFSHMVLV